METLINFLSQPMPWYVAGPLIGLTVPALLIMGNKSFGLSSSLKHICAACIPAKIPFFRYDWKAESWNLFFVLGIFLGGFVAMQLLPNPKAMVINPKLVQELASYGIHEIQGLMPTDLFNWENLLTLKGFILMIVGGFFIGFGTRYADGCTSGHAIFGISTLQLPSLIATICFMVGGFIMANFILPFILSL